MSLWWVVGGLSAVIVVLVWWLVVLVGQLDLLLAVNQEFFESTRKLTEDK